MSHTQHPDLITTEEVAEIVRRTPRTVRSWREKRVGPPYRVLHGRVLYQLEAVLDWMRIEMEHVYPQATQ